ncbi:MAG TPA: DUF4258 domain-containing protein [Crocinitomicaceae bacterium]|nr:DUF4258 domain-containing protein [Crocinitomicaceae bacterium]
MKSSLGTRFLYYFTGFGIGIIFVIFFFQNRGCSWTPKNRVKQAITDRVIVISEDVQHEMIERGITEKMIREVVTKGEIDFKKSKKDDYPKVYNLYTDHLRLNFSLPENSFISEVTVGFKDVKSFKNSTKGQAKLFLFPNEKRLIHVDSLVTFSDEFIQLGRPKNEVILNALKKSGAIDFEKSDFQAKPKVEQYLTCTINGKKIGMKTFWYMNRINIFALEILQNEKENS